MSYSYSHPHSHSSLHPHPSQTAYCSPFDHPHPRSDGDNRRASTSSESEMRSPPRDRGGNLTFGSACTRCRSSKTKCDGISPTCSRCAKYGKSCFYSTPKRRVYPNSLSSRTSRTNSPASTSSHPLLAPDSHPDPSSQTYITPRTTGRSPLPPSPPASDTSSDHRRGSHQSNTSSWGHVNLYPHPQAHAFRDRSSSLWSLASTASTMSSVHSVPSHGRPISPPQYQNHPPPTYQRDDRQQQGDSLTLAPFADPSRAMGSRTRLPSATKLFPELKPYAVRELESLWHRRESIGSERAFGAW